MLLATQESGGKSYESSNNDSAREVQRGRQASGKSLCQRARYEATHSGLLEGTQFLWREMGRQCAAAFSPMQRAISTQPSEGSFIREAPVEYCENCASWFFPKQSWRWMDSIRQLSVIIFECIIGTALLYKTGSVLIASTLCTRTSVADAHTVGLQWDWLMNADWQGLLLPHTIQVFRLQRLFTRV